MLCILVRQLSWLGAAICMLLSNLNMSLLDLHWGCSLLQRVLNICPSVYWVGRRSQGRGQGESVWEVWILHLVNNIGLPLNTTNHCFLSKPSKVVEMGLRGGMNPMDKTVKQKEMWQQHLGSRKPVDKRNYPHTSACAGSLEAGISGMRSPRNAEELGGRVKVGGEQKHCLKVCSRSSHVPCRPICSPQKGQGGRPSHSRLEPGTHASEGLSHGSAENRHTPEVCRRHWGGRHPLSVDAQNSSIESWQMGLNTAGKIL